MKRLTILAVFLVTLCLSVEIRKPTNVHQEALKKIIGEKKWASIILKLAEIHLTNSGPLDPLITAINNVVGDLEGKLENAHADYAVTQQEHESEVRRLEEEIRQAEIDISNSESLIQNVLIPQKEQLEEEIANLERRISDLEEHITQATADRELAHQDYLTRQEEHSEAIAACEEAQEVLNTLINGDTSLVQVTQAKNTLDIVAQKLKGHEMEDGFAKALLALSTEEFADQSALQRVWDLLDQIKNNLAGSQVQETNDEEQAQSDYEADMHQSRQDISDSSDQLSESQQMHAQNEENIQSNEDHITQRTADKVQAEQDLQNENDAFQVATDNYNTLVAQLENELDACRRALDVLNGADIADYLGDRMEMDRVIDTNHGSGIRVNEDQWVDRV